MRSGCWDSDLTAREILFQDKIFNKSFFRQLQDCQECAQVLELAVVEEEKQKCRAVRDLRNFLTGSVNSNELNMPRVQAFLDELKIGLLDANLLEIISSKDEHISWGETDFVKKAIGDILSATRPGWNQRVVFHSLTIHARMAVTCTYASFLLLREQLKVQSIP